MPRVQTDYDEATDYEDALPPETIREGLPEDLQDARVKGGKTYPADASIRLNGPPGTGKTTQMCLRVAVLIEEHGIDPSEITIVTYRRSLAGEIADRLKDWGVIGDDADLSMWTTAHAAANRVTGLLSGTYDENTSRGLGGAGIEFKILAAVTIGATLLAGVFAGWVIYPQTEPSGEALLFWENINAESLDEYESEIKGLDEDAVLGELIEENHLLAEVASNKYWRLKISLVSTAGTVFFATLSMVSMFWLG